MTPYDRGYSDFVSGQGYRNAYDKGTDEYNRYAWGFSDAKFCSGRESEEKTLHTTKIRLKPIISEVEIDGGSWKYVVLNENNKAVAMFVLYEEAESYIDIAYCPENYTIREYDGEN